jgi:hypothetical protein
MLGELDGLIETELSSTSVSSFDATGVQLYLH